MAVYFSQLSAEPVILVRFGETFGNQDAYLADAQVETLALDLPAPAYRISELRIADLRPHGVSLSELMDIFRLIMRGTIHASGYPEVIHYLVTDSLIATFARAVLPASILQHCKIFTTVDAALETIREELAENVPTDSVDYWLA